jgi:SagB-type dehydrogenase family enzyme
MKLSWVTSTGNDLQERHEMPLFELYHENSKLFPETARQQAGDLRLSGIELYLSSRGFRQYSDKRKILLPEIATSGETLQAVMLRRRSSRNVSGEIEFAQLATLLVQSLGPTAVVQNESAGIAQAIRAWPSAGGLYPIDTYVIASRVQGVDSGIYHYNPILGALEHLPSRSVEAVLRDGFFWQDFVLSSSVVVVLVAVFDRSVAKYGERGYRLVILDAGHAAQNILLTAEQLSLGAVAVGGFCDDALAVDLGLDGISEAVIHTVVAGPKHE